MTYSQLFGVTDGGSAPVHCYTHRPVGSVGDVFNSIVSSALGSGFTIGNFGNVTSLALTPGIWLVSGTVGAAFLTSLTRNIMAISAFSANTTTDHVVGYNLADVPLGVTGALSGTMTIASFQFNTAASATVYLKSQLSGAVGNILTGSITALRIR